MPRSARIVVRGYPYHIVQRGNNRQDIFFDPQDRFFYLKLLKKYSVEGGCAVCAYCLMHNHVHCLLVPGRDDSLAKTMQKLALCYTQYINKRFERSGTLWESRYYSALVDTDSYLWAVCRYIERNPVRAGIAETPYDYPWTSIMINAKGEKSDLVEPFWSRYGDSKDKEEYRDFVLLPEDGQKINMIRKSTSTGKPIGNESFFDFIENNFGICCRTKSKGRPKGRTKKMGPVPI